jgi:hypothetical protein
MMVLMLYIENNKKNQEKENQIMFNKRIQMVFIMFKTELSISTNNWKNLSYMFEKLE